MAITAKTVDRTCALVLLLAFCALIFLEAGLEVRRRAAERRDADELARRLDQLTQARAVLLKANEGVVKARQAAPDLKRRVPPAGEIGGFLGAVDGLTRARQIVLIDLQPQTKIKGEPFARVPVRLTCVGAFTDLHHLIYDLETMAREVRLDNVLISADTLSHKCRLQVNASLFER